MGPPIKRVITLFAAMALSLPGVARARVYTLDSQHTSVQFKVRHLFTSVVGQFEKFDGTIEFDTKTPRAAKVRGTIDAASLNTNVDKRDAHLRSAEFFDVKNHPKIKFESVKVTQWDDKTNTGKMSGKLTIRDTTKPVILDVAFLGEGKDPWGNQLAGFNASTTIDRRDFGLTWNETLETGGVLVGDDVAIEIEVSAAPKE